MYDCKNRRAITVHSMIHHVSESPHNSPVNDAFINDRVHLRRLPKAFQHIFYTFEKISTQPSTLLLVPTFGAGEVLLCLTSNDKAIRHGSFSRRAFTSSQD